MLSPSSSNTFSSWYYYYLRYLALFPHCTKHNVRQTSQYFQLSASWKLWPFLCIYQHTSTACGFNSLIPLSSSTSQSLTAHQESIQQMCALHISCIVSVLFVIQESCNNCPAKHFQSSMSLSALFYLEASPNESLQPCTEKHCSKILSLSSCLSVTKHEKIHFSNSSTMKCRVLLYSLSFELPLLYLRYLLSFLFHIQVSIRQVPWV